METLIVPTPKLKAASRAAVTRGEAVCVNSLTSDAVVARDEAAGEDSLASVMGRGGVLEEV